MNEENDWDYNVEGDAVEGPVDCVYMDVLVHVLNEYRKSTWTFRCIVGVDCC